MKIIYTKSSSYWHDSDNKNPYCLSIKQLKALSKAKKHQQRFEKKLAQHGTIQVDNQNALNKETYNWLPNYFEYKKQDAIKRNLEFNLDYNTFFNWYKSSEERCFYCNIKLNHYIRIRHFILNYDIKTPYAIDAKQTVFNYNWVYKHRHLTIDRIDSNKGYVEGNICKCCWICNRKKLKQQASYNLQQELKDYVRKLYKEIFRFRHTIRNKK